MSFAPRFYRGSYPLPVLYLLQLLHARRYKLSSHLHRRTAVTVQRNDYSAPPVRQCHLFLQLDRSPHLVHRRLHVVGSLLPQLRLVLLRTLHLAQLHHVARCHVHAFLARRRVVYHYRLVAVLRVYRSVLHHRNVAVNDIHRHSLAPVLPLAFQLGVVDRPISLTHLAVLVSAPRYHLVGLLLGSVLDTVHDGLGVDVSVDYCLASFAPRPTAQHGVYPLRVLVVKPLVHGCNIPLAHYLLEVSLRSLVLCPRPLLFPLVGDAESRLVTLLGFFLLTHALNVPRAGIGAVACSLVLVRCCIVV